MRCRRRCRAECRQTADAREFQLQTAVLNKAVYTNYSGREVQFAAINECTRQRGGIDGMQPICYIVHAILIRHALQNIIIYIIVYDIM